MGRHFVSYEAQCPFYRAEDRKVIYCEGVEQGSSLHNAFAGSAAPYKERYCCARWEDCRIARCCGTSTNERKEGAERGVFPGK